MKLTYKTFRAAIFSALTMALLHGEPPPVYNRNALDVQSARANYVKTKGKDVTYTRKWDLTGLPSYKPEVKVYGTIRIWGLNYLADGYLAQYWEDGFRKFQPGVTFEYNLPTALIAISGLVSGKADLAASRPITYDEHLLFQRIFNQDPLDITMVTGSFDISGWANAVAFLVNKANPLSQLTIKQLDGILGAERAGGYDEGLTWHPERARGPKENIRTWGQLGLTGDWRDKPINILMVTMKFHTAPIIERVVFNGGTKWNEQIREYSNYARPDGSLALTSRQITADLENDPYGLAVTSIKDLSPKTKALALATKESGPYVELTIENVQNRSYPLFSEEHWYLPRPKGRPVEAKLKEYLRYTLSREGQEEVARDGKFLPLTAEVVREQLKKLE